MDLQLKNKWSNQSHDDLDITDRNRDKSSHPEFKRLGKLKSNRGVILSQIHKRFSSFEKDYRKLLATVCNSLAVPANLIKSMVNKFWKY